MENLQKQKKKQSLVGRMALIISVIFFLSIILIFVFNFFITKSMIEKNTEENMIQNVTYYKTEVKNWLDIRIDQLNMLKYSIEQLPKKEKTEENVRELIENSTEYGQQYGVISDYIVFPNKHMISGDGWVPEKGYDPTQKDYYKKALEENLYISTPYIDATTQEFVITISTSIKIDGTLYAVLARDLTITEVKQVVDSYKSSQGSYLYLLDEEGNILSHEDEEYQTNGSKVVNIYDISWDMLKEIADQKKSVLQNDYDHEKKRFIAVTEEQSGWTIGYVYPNSIIMKNLTRQIVWNMIVFVITLCVSITIVVRILRKKLLPIQELAKVAQDLENGHLDVTLDVKSNDEIGRLAIAFHNTTNYLQNIISEISYMLTQISMGNLNVNTQCEYRGDFIGIQKALQHITSNLNQVIGGIDVAANQVLNGANQVSDHAQMLSQGAVEQAGQIETLVQGMEEVQQAVNNNVKRCESAGEATSKVASKLEESNEYMEDMMRAMDKISNASNEIGKIIKTIQDIAFQTNILALNASIEAARAGQAGKGFAVVADEVGDLATKSAEAAKNTTVMIENSIKMVEEGTAVANETANSLVQAVEVIKEVVKETQEIAILSNEQAREINQISSGIAEISSVVQLNSASSEESAETSKKLSEQAHNMKELLNKFNMR